MERTSHSATVVERGHFDVLPGCPGLVQFGAEATEVCTDAH